MTNALKTEKQSSAYGYAAYNTYSAYGYYADNAQETQTSKDSEEKANPNFRDRLRAQQNLHQVVEHLMQRSRYFELIGYLLINLPSDQPQRLINILNACRKRNLLHSQPLFNR